MKTGYERFLQQNVYEAEGAVASLTGKNQEDCPYNRGTESEAWNFWTMGFDIARSEKKAIQKGTLTFSSTASDAVPFEVPIDQAIRSKMWKPKYVSITKKSS